MKESISKTFRFSQEVVEILDELKPFIATEGCSDNLAMNMLIKSYYQDIYIKESQNKFLELVGVFCKVYKETYNLDEEQISIVNKVFEITINELAVLRAIKKWSIQKTYSEYVRCIDGSMSGFGEEECISVIMDLEVWNRINENINRRLNEELKLSSTQLPCAKKMLKSLKYLSIEIESVGRDFACDELSSLLESNDHKLNLFE